VLGAIIIVVLIVVVLPVSILMGGGVIAAVLGWSGSDDAENRHEGSELIDLS
jgi:hypothetical protein